MSNEYMDLVIMTNGKVCRVPGFSNIKPGWKAVALGFIYEVLEVVSVPESEALLTLPKAYGIIHPLEYNDEQSCGQKEKAN